MDGENDSSGPLTTYITFESELHTRPMAKRTQDDYNSLQFNLIGISEEKEEGREGRLHRIS